MFYCSMQVIRVKELRGMWFMKVKLLVILCENWDTTHLHWETTSLIMVSRYVGILWLKVAFKSFVDHFVTNLTEPDGSHIPILAANIDASEEPKLQGTFTATTEFVIQGVKIGIVGYLTEETQDISDTGKLKFENVVETVKKYTQELRDNGCQIVIGVGHYGYQV